MKTFIVIGYVVPDGGHVVTEVAAEYGTSAALAVREKLGVTKNEFEVIGVVEGPLRFERIDERQVALAPYRPVMLE